MDPDDVRTQGGVTVYRQLDVPLVRQRAPALARSWMVLHRITAGSPLSATIRPRLLRGEVELTLAVSGVDETSLQAVHAQHTWVSQSIAWIARIADVLSETADGNLFLDLRRFHDLCPAEPATN